MTRVRVGFVLALIALGGLAFEAQTPPAAAYGFQQIVPGIYSAIGTGTMNVGSNSAVIVNRDDDSRPSGHCGVDDSRFYELIEPGRSRLRRRMEPRL